MKKSSDEYRVINFKEQEVSDKINVYEHKYNVYFQLNAQEHLSKAYIGDVFDALDSDETVEVESVESETNMKLIFSGKTERKTMKLIVDDEVLFCEKINREEFLNQLKPIYYEEVIGMIVGRNIIGLVAKYAILLALALFLYYFFVM